MYDRVELVCPTPYLVSTYRTRDISRALVYYKIYMRIFNTATQTMEKLRESLNDGSFCDPEHKETSMDLFIPSSQSSSSSPLPSPSPSPSLPSSSSSSPSPSLPSSSSSSPSPSLPSSSSSSSSPSPSPSPSSSLSTSSLSLSSSIKNKNKNHDHDHQNYYHCIILPRYLAFQRFSTIANRIQIQTMNDFSN